MATKPFNPLADPLQALQFLMMNSPRELLQQSVRAASIVKARLDLMPSMRSELEVLRGQNEVLRDQVALLTAEVTSLQFQERFQEPEVKRGRKTESKNVPTDG